MLANQIRQSIEEQFPAQHSGATCSLRMVSKRPEDRGELVDLDGDRARKIIAHYASKTHLKFAVVAMAIANLRGENDTDPAA